MAICFDCCSGCALIFGAAYNLTHRQQRQDLLKHTEPIQEALLVLCDMKRCHRLMQLA